MSAPEKRGGNHTRPRPVGGGGGGGYRLTMELHLRTRTSCKVVATFCSIGGPTRNCNTPANSLEHTHARSLRGSDVEND